MGGGLGGGRLMPWADRTVEGGRSLLWDWVGSSFLSRNANATAIEHAPVTRSEKSKLVGLDAPSNAAGRCRPS